MTFLVVASSVLFGMATSATARIHLLRRRQYGNLRRMKLLLPRLVQWQDIPPTELLT